MPANSPQTPRIALTFDNGPTPGVTEQILDILAEHSLQAYFFVVSDHVNAHPHGAKLLERMLREGHIVGNHSASHGAPLGELTSAEAIAEITTAHEALREYLGEHFLLRPWGTEGVLERRCLNHAAVEYLVSGKHTCVLWNSVPGDWLDPFGWMHRALADVAAQDHTVVVLHDLPTGALNQLPQFLTELEHAGVAVVQGLPEACVPIKDGRMVRSIEHLVSSNRP